MDFKQLKYIMAIVRTGNITKAADELYMTQPALSHFISKLEKEENIQLFDRTTVPVRLTYAGEIYVETARKILELNDQLNIRLSEITGNVSGRITIGIPPARAASVLPKIIPEFAERYPKVEIRTVEHNSRQLKEDLEKERIDFAILPVIHDSRQFRVIQLFEEELYLVSRKGVLTENCWHLNEDGEKVVNISSLGGQKFILLKRGHGARDAIDLLFSLNHFRPDIFLETTNNETAFMLAAAGCAIAIVPSFNIETLRPVNEIEVFKISDTGMKWNIAALLPKYTQESFLVQECISLIREKYGEPNVQSTENRSHRG